MELMQIPPNASDPADERSYERLLKSAIRLNAILLGIVMGIGLGFSLFFGTHISLAVTGEKAGRYLNLLGVFLPGYSASPGGAWIGLLWGFVIGAFSGSFVYYVYARNVGPRLAEMITPDQTQGEIVEQPRLRLSGHALGIALGSLMAIQLFLTTSWLVIRGTADQSPHAALLKHYLPGYSVDFMGVWVGAIEIFVFTYALSLVLSGTYNKILARRHGRAVR